MKSWFSNLVVLVSSLVVALGIAEVVTRIVVPISDGGKNITLDGKPIRGFLSPGETYRQISTEYDALTTITPEGYRAPRAENPDVVFLGDSFTFGWGLSDTETFASIYCGRLNVTCANLGTPGSGTRVQVKKLRQVLERLDWRPKEVKLFVFAMAASFSGGNDLKDNYDYVRWSPEPGYEPAKEGPAPTQSDPGARAADYGNPGLLERLLEFRYVVLRNSNLVRLAKYQWGPLLRSALVPAVDRERMEEALEITRTDLSVLNQLASERGFEYHIYVIHPVQDLIRQTFPETAAVIQSISPVPVHTTAPALLDDPASYYYPYDGHLNAAGSLKIADFLIEQDQGSDSTEQDLNDEI